MPNRRPRSPDADAEAAASIAEAERLQVIPRATDTPVDQLAPVQREKDYRAHPAPPRNPRVPFKLDTP